jgi:2-methylcitrate dehydratase PrpD
MDQIVGTLTDHTVSTQWAEFGHDLAIERLPPAIAALAKDRLLDSLATAVAAHGLPVPTAAMALATAGGPCTIIGEPGGFAPADAAFVNATLVNGRTQDDFLDKSHPGAVVVPAALAAAEALGGKEPVSGQTLLAAIVVGYEMTSRAYLGGPRMLPRFRATGVAGTIGAAAAAARVLGLDRKATVNALGLGAIFACGFGAGFLTGTMDVKLNVGMAARNGVSAALLARGGATASPAAFEGPAGYYAAMSNGTEDVEEALRGLGEHLAILDTVYKEYPICIFAQTPVALARELVVARGVKASEIDRVQVTVCEATYTNPGFTNVAPFASALNARVSARFCIAAAFLSRPIDEFGFYEDFHDPEVLALADRIDLTLDPARGDTVDIEVWCGQRRFHTGGSEGETLHPTHEKVVAKVRRIVTPSQGARVDALIDAVMALDAGGNIATLAAMLRPA